MMHSALLATYVAADADDAVLTSHEKCPVRKQTNASIVVPMMQSALQHSVCKQMAVADLAEQLGDLVLF